MPAPQSPPMSNREIASGADRKLRRKEILAIAAGSLAAVAMALELANLHNRANLSLLPAFLWSVFSVGLTVAVGAIGFYLAARMLALPASDRARTLWRRAAVAWVFQPVMVLWLGRGSLAALAVAAFAAASVAMNLRIAFPDVDGASSRPHSPPGAFGSLYGLPKGNSQPARAALIAVAAYGSIAFACADHLYCAVALLMLAFFVLVWRWNSVESRAVGYLSRRITLRKLGGVAVVLMILALLPRALLTLPGYHSPGDKASGPEIPPPVLAAERGFDYVGIVLWPPKKHVIVVAPKTSINGSGLGKPLVIPFDGPYWYFQPPRLTPGPYAHVAHGKPSDLNVHATNLLPLEMEAHQNLRLPIDIGSCGAIDVTLLNKDAGPEPIEIGLLLGSSSNEARHAEFLGKKVLPDSSAGPRQTLEFSIPQIADFEKFDAITVVFIPPREYARYGAKVSVESFTLIPR
jgi:hypothetical protein